MRDEEYKTLVNWIENALGRYYENDDGTIEISGGDFRYIVDIKNPSITMVCELSGKDRFGKHKIIPVEHGWRAKDYIDVLRDITSNDTLKRSIFMEKTNMKDMSLLEAIEILNKNGFVCESDEEISIDELIAFAKLNCSKALGAAVSVKDRCEWPLVEIDITGDAVFKKYNGICITGYFKERTGAGARRGASKYFSIFPEENKLVVGPGTSERVNGKSCRLITNEYTYNSWDDLIKFFNSNNFNTTKLPKTLKEAYDAVTDHQRTKANRYEDYDCNITKSLQRMLREEGYTVSIKYSDEITVSKSRKERYKVTLVTHGTYGATDYNYSKGNDIGAESETRSAHVYHEETVEINVKGIDYNVNFGSEEFDIRDLPGIVAYIIDCIETY